MLLTMDVGNSDIVTILYDGNKNIIKKDRSPTIKKDCHRNYLNFISDLQQKFAINEVNYIVSCVVPSVKKALSIALEKTFGKKGIFIDYQTFPGISKLLNPPEEIGADLIASSVEIIKNFSQPAIIVDMGTATKVIVVNDNTIVGVSIILGLQKNRDAIVESIPHLPEVELNLPKNIIGQSTIESIQSGLIFSAIKTIEGYTQYVEKKYNTAISKVITGGMSFCVKENLKDFTYKKTLINDGLFTLYSNQ